MTLLSSPGSGLRSKGYPFLDEAYNNDNFDDNDDNDDDDDDDDGDDGKKYDVAMCLITTFDRK